ncbi:hypothetical protein SBA2_810020 [Acidobacteriia bacterium SbA2]|nr:hypothetical protein SBA2_810020 [Acidobacteriia bacterium SbA2]
MKTKSRGVEELRTRGVAKPNQGVTRQDADCLSLFDSQLSTLNCLTRIRRNKARMSMKTKDKYKMSLSPQACYHPYGAANNMRLGMEYQMAGTAPASQECIEELRDELEKVGLLRTSSSLTDASPGLYYDVLS